MVLPDFSNPAIASFFAVYAGLIGLAALTGDWPERLGALVFALIPIAQSALYATVGSQQFLSLDWGLLVIDAFAVGGLAGIAYNSESLWPPRVTAMMIFSPLSHIARIGLPSFQEMSYVQFNVLPTVLALAILTIGALAFRVRKIRGFSDRPWTPYAEQDKIRKVLGMID